MFKKYTQFALFLFLFLLPLAVPAASGPHGGQIHKMFPYQNSLLIPGYFIELVDQSQSSSQEKEFRIYLLQSGSRPVDLIQSGYWAVSWHFGKKQGQFQDNLAQEKQKIWKETTPLPLHSFVARGDIPKDRNLKIEVVIALPGKGGAGMAIFYPYR